MRSCTRVDFSRVRQVSKSAAGLSARKLPAMHPRHSPALPSGRWEVVGVFLAGVR
jgi:hypothetical protein